MRIVLRGAAILVIAAICALSLVPGQMRPHVLSSSQLEHLFAYLVAAALLLAAFSEKIGPVRIVFLLTAYGAFLELGQRWITGRAPRLIDVGADFLGALIGMLISILVLAISRSVMTRTAR
jgi:VanZ family protein